MHQRSLPLLQSLDAPGGVLRSEMGTHLQTILESGSTRPVPKPPSAFGYDKAMDRKLGSWSALDTLTMPSLVSGDELSSYRKADQEPCLPHTQI